MLNHYASLPDEAGGTRHYWLSRNMQDLGWQTHIIRATPAGRVTSPKPHVTAFEGVGVTSLGLSRGKLDATGRIASWAAFTALTQVPISTAHLPTPQFVLGSSVHLGASWAARRLARRHRARFILEVRDLWPETLIALGRIKRDSAIARSMLGLERSLARSADLVVSPLPAAQQYMADFHGIPARRCLWLPNGVDMATKSRYPLPRSQTLRIQYLGSLGLSNDVATILDAVRLANAEQRVCELQIIGYGTHKQSLQLRVRQDPELRDVVTIVDPVASEDVPAVMAWANAAIIQVLDRPALYRYGFSANKCFEYLASGRWIIMGADVPLNPVAGAPGAVVAAPDARALAEAIVASARTPQDERNRRAWANIEFARQRYDFAVTARTLSEALIYKARE